jgi:hypothetical protein
VVRPAIDIQTEKKAEVGYSEFWAPIREGKLGELFTGKPVPIKDEGAIAKSFGGMTLWLKLRKNRCYVQLFFLELEHREEVMKLFPESKSYEFKEAVKSVSVIFHVINKGRDDRGSWDEIREKLVAKGTDIYNKINESNL